MNNSEVISLNKTEVEDCIATNNLSLCQASQDCEEQIESKKEVSDTDTANEEDLCRTIIQLKNDLERKSNSARSLRLNLNKKKKEIKKLVTEKNKLEGENGKLNNTVSLLKNENRKLKEQIKEYEKRIIDLNDEIDNTMQHLNYCSAELQTYKEAEMLLSKYNIVNKLSNIKKTTIYELINFLYTIISKK